MPGELLLKAAQPRATKADLAAAERQLGVVRAERLLEHVAEAISLAKVTPGERSGSQPTRM